MPFGYYGGKKGLARHYPPPAERTIVEPFAGSAGYALHWAKPGTRVVLVERDPRVAALWRRLQRPGLAEELRSMPRVRAGQRTADLLVASAMSLGNVFSSTTAKDWAVTERIERDWPRLRDRVLTALPIVSDWTIIEGDYTDAPDIRATWFIDPPYWVPDGTGGTRGDGYRHGASGIDFDKLAEWCKSRKGQVIVCEQDGASWLPFRPLRNMTTAAGDGGRRLEVVWTRTPGSMLATPRSRAAKEAAAKRRSARMRRG